MENSLAPINRIPPEIFSVIPDYWGEDSVDKDLIALTHVCRQWRDVLAARSSLWTRIHLTSIDITRTFVQRSHSSPWPLDFYIEGDEDVDDAFALVVPHIGRVQSLTIYSTTLPTVLEHFHCKVALLQKLDIEIHDSLQTQFIDDAFLSGNLSSMRELRLCGVRLSFPRTNLPNLRVFKLKSDRFSCGVTEILDFLQSAPLLQEILFNCPPTFSLSSDAPRERTVTLHHLKVFTFHGFQQEPFLLRHLAIPTRASFIIPGFCFGEGASELLSHHPKRVSHPKNLSDIDTTHLSDIYTVHPPDADTVHLFFGSTERSIRFSGPNGSLHAFGTWKERVPPRGGTISRGRDVNDSHILDSLDDPTLSMIQKLSISNYPNSIAIKVEQFPIFRKLSSAEQLQILVLINCTYHNSFIRTLDPKENESGRVLCPEMKELFFEVERWAPMDSKFLIQMLKNRASRLKGTDTRISSIKWVDWSGKLPWEGQRDVLFELFEDMKNFNVKGQFSDTLPNWCVIPSNSL